ncbi:hypothetical protein [Microbacterium terricola]|uniref:Uncharacterized protein n=1 Tax=Microbacterium terricola TaxID=344163 RepID=A0ABM8E375_9MICO|nr:hypothetical protein [Microbacterium terricola]UYK40058.1 hypothetical protein OAU46_15435 [Microbacterium terricola]BDV32245.1 hypothetical protein Microterr_29050 [Microbacterium terricola]
MNSESPINGHGINTPLTEHSAPGVYIVITGSRTLYQVEIISHDALPVITRYPVVNGLLKDGTPLPGVSGFQFDATTGLGEIRWWKDDPNDYDRPDLTYAGTIRTTSRVLVIAQVSDIPAAHNLDRPPVDEGRPGNEAVVDLIRTTIASLDSYEKFAVFVELLLVGKRR